MADVRIELNRDEIHNLLNSPELGKACDKAAAKMTRDAGVKYVSQVRISGDRIAARGYERADDDRNDNS